MFTSESRKKTKDSESVKNTGAPNSTIKDFVSVDERVLKTII